MELCTQDEERISTTAIAACELYAGAYKSTKKKRDLEVKIVRELLARMELLEFSVQACERFGKIRFQLEATGSPIGDLDIMIASIAITHNQSVLTRDVEHFEKVTGLTVETW